MAFEIHYIDDTNVVIDNRDLVTTELHYQDRPNDKYVIDTRFALQVVMNALNNGAGTPSLSGVNTEVQNKPIPWHSACAEGRGKPCLKCGVVVCSECDEVHPCVDENELRMTLEVNDQPSDNNPPALSVTIQNDSLAEHLEYILTRHVFDTQETRSRWFRAEALGVQDARHHINRLNDDIDRTNAILAHVKGGRYVR